MLRSSILATLLASQLEAQVPADLARERAGFAEWLATAYNSPMVAIGLAPVGPGIRIGPADAEIPFPGINTRIVAEPDGAITVSDSTGKRLMIRHQAMVFGPLTLVRTGRPEREVVVVYGGERKQQVPTYYPYDPTKVFIGPLHSIEPRHFPTLGLDGVEVDATEVGSVVIPDGTGSTRLRVYRIPDSSGEESELMVYFRDGTSDKGSYPAGRFVALHPLPEGKYRLDLNRAMNPFCAYRSVYPCPAPWPGNTLTMAVEAGEQYK